MKEVLFDTNIIPGFALKREPFFEEAFELFILIDKQNIIGNINATTITDIYYLSKKEKGHKTSIDFIKVVDVVGIDKNIINKSPPF